MLLSALDFFYGRNESLHIFWTDISEDRIYRGSLTGDMLTQRQSILHSGLTTAEGLAVDWIGGEEVVIVTRLLLLWRF